ncbi:Ras GTPase-activating protein family - IQGAP [Pseudoloma neurophilia]|uniref:Ras GTPase-activating protein family-IQGAP n=1 Tax=Pseudoloma neurophilia TaxID=146866 RepID=A0A0R0M4J4_9MICR|nr:Ras GTPase-activating protein family - IQGAP [Pseudoloma neurophilia]
MTDRQMMTPDHFSNVEKNISITEQKSDNYSKTTSKHEKLTGGNSDEIDIHDPKNKPENRTIHERLTTQEVITADEMDQRRRYQKEYDYLCYMAQARDWIARLINYEMENNLVFKEEIQKGEIFVKLSGVLINENLRVYSNDELVYRHSDNHNLFLNILRQLKLKECYFYSIIDAYNGKNIPSIIYCLHALSNHCEKLGFAFQIKKEQNYTFSESEFKDVKKDIENFNQYDFETIGQEKNDSDGKNDSDENDNLPTDINDLNTVHDSDQNSDDLNSLDEQNQSNSRVNTTTDLTGNKEHLVDSVKQKLENPESVQYSDHLKTAFRHFLRRNTMREVFKGDASLFSIREVLKRQSLSHKYEIEQKHSKIKSLFEKNNGLEREIDQKLLAIELVIQNKRLFSGLPTNLASYSNNERLSRIFNIMRQEPQILLNVLSKVDNPEMFLCRYVLPLFLSSTNNSSNSSGVDNLRDEFLVLRIIDQSTEKFNELTGLLVVNLFKGSENARELAKKLLIRETIQLSDEKQQYLQSLEHIKQIVNQLLDQLFQNVYLFPHYLVHCFSKSKNDLITFYREVISPLIVAPSAFLLQSDKNNMLLNNLNTLNTIDSVLEGAILQSYKTNYYKPLEKYGETVYARFSSFYENILNISNLSVQSNLLFRVNRPFIKITHEQCNEFITVMKDICPIVLQDISNIKTDIHSRIVQENPEQNVDIFNDFVSKMVINEQPEGEDLKIYLHSVVNDKINNSLDNIIDIIRVSKGNDLNNIMNRKSTQEEELAYKKLVNYKSSLQNSINQSDQESVIFDINDRLSHLDTLKNKNSQILNYSNTIKNVCECLEENQIIMNQKTNELTINNRTIENLKKKQAYLVNNLKNYNDYYNSLLQAYYKKGKNCNKENTYRYSLNSLSKQNVVILSGDSNNSTDLFIECARPGYFTFTLGQLHDKIVLEDLLKNRESEIALVNLRFKCKGLIRILNECWGK